MVVGSTRSLLPFLEKLGRCHTPAEVGRIALDTVRVGFGCHIGAALFLDDSQAPFARSFFGCREADIEDYEQRWRPRDRVFVAVMARAAPVHNWQVYGEEEWRNDPVWTDHGRRLGIYHYMAAPIFGSRGRLIGVLTCCRRVQNRRFDATSLDMASAFSGYLSATLSRVTLSGVVEDGGRDRLAPRELQVARLAAAGRNNLQIAHALGLARETIKQALRRAYTKLGVSGRAQMAATLAMRGLLEQ